MARRKLVIKPVAERDVIEIGAYLRTRNSAASDRFLKAVQLSLKKLSRMPELGGIREFDNPTLLGVRDWPVSRFKNYRIFYRVTEQSVQILRLLHAAREAEPLLDEAASAGALTFNSSETAACHQLVHLALTEDLGQSWEHGDLTSAALIPHDHQSSAGIRFREQGVLAGLPAVEMVLNTIDSRLNVLYLYAEGECVPKGYLVARVEGPTFSLLRSERIALNFLQHLSGIATVTRRYVDAVAGLPVQILDTRKTLPGWRLLEKYAVRQGGGHNHRLGLYDGILVKDNHLAARRDLSLSEVVAEARRRQPSLPVEIEVDNLDQLNQALPGKPDIVLLDNMSPGLLKQAVEIRNNLAPHVRLEASGGITLANVRTVAQTGVDRISLGALTHSTPALDIGLDYDAA